MRILLIPFVAMALACASDDSGSGADGGVVTDANPSEVSTIISVGGDFSGNGVLTVVQLPSMRVTVNAVVGVAGGDPVLRALGDRLVVLDRFGGDTVTVLDRDLQLIGQASTGPGSNPQDAAIVGDSLFVVLYGTSKVIRFNLLDLSAGIQGEIDLSGLDSDGNANCASVYAVGQKLFVTCQLLRPDFSAKGPGVIAVVDVASESIETTIELQAANPVSFLKQAPSGDLLVSTVLSPLGFDPQAKGSGCVERIQTSPASVLPCELTNRELGGYANEMAAGADSVYFVKSIAFGLASLHELKDGVLQELELPGLGDNLAGVAVCPNGDLVVSDNTVGGRGLRVYSGTELAGGELLDVGWPTVSFPTNGTICW